MIQLLIYCIRNCVTYIFLTYTEKKPTNEKQSHHSSMRTLFQLARVQYLYWAYIQNNGVDYPKAFLSVTTHEGLPLMTPFDWVQLFTDMIRLYRSSKWISIAIREAQLSDTVVCEMWSIAHTLFKVNSMDLFSWKQILYPEILVRPVSFLRSIRKMTCPFRIYDLVPEILFKVKDFELLMECLRQSPQPYKPIEAIALLVRKIKDDNVREFWKRHFPHPNWSLDSMYVELIESTITIRYEASQLLLNETLSPGTE